MSVTVSLVDWIGMSHNMCSKYSPFSLTQVYCGVACIMRLVAESQHSVAVTLSRISAELHLLYGREAVY